jgi:hypothetical protein
MAFRRDAGLPNGGDLNQGVFSAPFVPAAISFRMVGIAGGYRLEAAIPWATIGIAPAPGVDIGLELQVGDDDNDGIPVADRDSKIAWADGYDYAFLDPGRFGTGTSSPPPEAPSPARSTRT